MYPRGVLLLLCSSSFRHALLAPLLGFQGHQERGLTYFKYTWSLAIVDFTVAISTHLQFQKKSLNMPFYVLSAYAFSSIL